jgi:hypothetical protein
MGYRLGERAGAGSAKRVLALEHILDAGGGVFQQR